jgi:segregation and condensation protein B
VPVQAADPAEAEIAPAAGEPEVAESDPNTAEAEPEAVEPEAAESELNAAETAVAGPALESEPESEDEDEDEGVLVGSGLPDLTEDEALHAALEALLLVVDSPAEVELLADALDQPVKRIRQALKTMAAGYAEQGRGIDLRDVGGGWRFYTRDIFAPFVEKLLLDGQRAKLTRAALESLAVIAYRQPVTRARVAAVRGVNVDGVIRTLLARGLIEETGTDKDTGGILYRTTELFLERLGLSSLEDLPPIAPLLPEVDAIDDV